MATLLGLAATDIAAMYDATHGHAETVTGPSGDFLAIWTAEFEAPDVDGVVQIQAQQPQFRSQDADALARGNTVTRGGVDYTVVDVQPDGYGETTHYLHQD